ncbi:hypothetical protein M8C21_032669, partial [Ambrosia artemisiifolia]
FGQPQPRYVVHFSSQVHIHWQLRALHWYLVAFKYPSGKILDQNDKLKLLKPVSLQHLDENMLAFLLHTVASFQLSKVKVHKAELCCGGRRWIIYGLGGDSHMRWVMRWRCPPSNFSESEKLHREKSENNALLAGDRLVFDNYLDKMRQLREILWLFPKQMDERFDSEKQRHEGRLNSKLPVASFSS